MDDDDDDDDKAFNQMSSSLLDQTMMNTDSPDRPQIQETHIILDMIHSIQKQQQQ